MSTNELLSKLTAKFDPAKAENLQVTYWFVVSDEEKSFGVRVAEQQCTVFTENLPTADVTLSADRETWQGIIGNNLSPQLAFMSGKLSVEGELPLALKLPGLFGLG